MFDKRNRKLIVKVAAVLALVGFVSNAESVLIEYDTLGRPILFDNLTYSHNVGSTLTTFNYDVTVTWDTFDSVYGTGYRSSGDPYAEPEFITTGNLVYNPMFAMAEALVADGFTDPHPVTGLPFGPSELFGSYLLIPYQLGQSAAGDWIVASEGLDLGHYIFTINPINYPAGSFSGGHTQFYSADTYDLAAVPVPPALLLFGSGIVALAASLTRARRGQKQS